VLDVRQGNVRYQSDRPQRGLASAEAAQTVQRPSSQKQVARKGIPATVSVDEFLASFASEENRATLDAWIWRRSTGTVLATK
jgi:hypothetical protein